MSKYVKYKGVKFRAVDAIGAFSAEAERLPTQLEKRLKKLMLNGTEKNSRGWIYH